MDYCKHTWFLCTGIKSCLQLSINKKISFQILQREYMDRLVQERRNSNALAMELRLSCTNPSIWSEQKRKLQWNLNGILQDKTLSRKKIAFTKWTSILMYWWCHCSILKTKFNRFTWKRRNCCALAVKFYWWLNSKETELHCWLIGVTSLALSHRYASFEVVGARHPCPSCWLFQHYRLGCHALTFVVTNELPRISFPAKSNSRIWWEI